MIGLGVWGAGLLAIALAGLTTRTRRSDIEVVLGSEVEAGGRPSARLAARLDRGIELYKAGWVDRILVSGGVEPSGVSEAAAMARYMVARNIPANAIIQDPTGATTADTARTVARLTAPTSRILVVTQYFHLPRAIMAIRNMGRRRVSGAYPHFAELRDFYSVVRESLALPVYALRFSHK